MAQYVPLPDGTYATVREDETPQEAYARARKEYPEAFKRREPEAKPESGFTPALRAGFESLKGEAALTAGKLGLMGLKEAEEYRAAREAEAKRIFKPTEEGWTEAPFAKIKELLGGSLPYMAAPVAAGLGVAAAPLTGTAAAITAGLAAGAASVAQFTGSNLARQIEEAEARGEDASLERAKLGNAVAAAVPQAALDVVSLRGIPLIRNLFKSVGKDITEKEAKALVEQGFKQKLADYGRTTLMTAGREGFTEAGQQYLERLQAGLEVTDPAARAEYLESFLGGAVLGGTLAPAGRFFERGREQGIAEAKLRDVDALRRKTEREEAEKQEALDAEKRKDPAYLRDLQARYTAARQEEERRNAEITALEKTGDPADKEMAKQKKAERQEFYRYDFNPVRDEYNAAGGNARFKKFAEEERVAGLTPLEYQMEQAGVEFPKEQPQASLQQRFVEEGTPAKVDPVQAYAKKQLDLAAQQDMGTFTEADYAQYLLQDREMAKKLVASNAQLPGLSKRQSAAILGGMKLQLQQEAKESYAGATELLGAQTTSPQQEFLAQWQEDQAKLDEERGESAFDTRLTQLVNTALKDMPKVQAPEGVRINRRADEILARIDELEETRNKAAAEAHRAFTLGNRELGLRKQAEVEAAQTALNELEKTGFTPATEAQQALFGVTPSEEKPGVDLARAVLEQRKRQDKALTFAGFAIADLREGVTLGGQDVATDKLAERDELVDQRDALAQQRQQLIDTAPPADQQTKADETSRTNQIRALDRDIAALDRQIDEYKVQGVSSSTITTLRNKINSLRAEYIDAALKEAATLYAARGKALTNDEALKYALQMQDVFNEWVTRSVASPRSDVEQMRVKTPAQMRGSKIVRGGELEAYDPRPLEQRRFGAYQAATEVIKDQLRGLSRKLAAVPEEGRRVQQGFLRTQFPTTEAERVAQERGERAPTLGGELVRRREYISNLIDRVLQRTDKTGIPIQVVRTLERAQAAIQEGRGGRDVLTEVSPEGKAGPAPFAAGLLDAAETLATRALEGRTAAVPAPTKPQENYDKIVAQRKEKERLLEQGVDEKGKKLTPEGIQKLEKQLTDISRFLAATPRPEIAAPRRGMTPQAVEDAQLIRQIDDALRMSEGREAAPAERLTEEQRAELAQQGFTFEEAGEPVVTKPMPASELRELEAQGQRFDIEPGAPAKPVTKQGALFGEDAGMELAFERATARNFERAPQVRKGRALMEQVLTLAKQLQARLTAKAQARAESANQRERLQRALDEVSAKLSGFDWVSEAYSPIDQRWLTDSAFLPRPPAVPTRAFAGFAQAQAYFEQINKLYEDALKARFGQDLKLETATPEQVAAIKQEYGFVTPVEPAKPEAITAYEKELARFATAAAFARRYNANITGAVAQLRRIEAEKAVMREFFETAIDPLVQSKSQAQLRKEKAELEKALAPQARAMLEQAERLVADETQALEDLRAAIQTYTPELKALVAEQEARVRAANKKLSDAYTKLPPTAEFKATAQVRQQQESLRAAFQLAVDKAIAQLQSEAKARRDADPRVQAALQRIQIGEETLADLEKELQGRASATLQAVQAELRARFGKTPKGAEEKYTAQVRQNIERERAKLDAARNELAMLDQEMAFDLDAAEANALAVSDFWYQYELKQRDALIKKLAADGFEVVDFDTARVRTAQGAAATAQQDAVRAQNVILNKAKQASIAAEQAAKRADQERLQRAQSGLGLPGVRVVKGVRGFAPVGKEVDVRQERLAQEREEDRIASLQKRLADRRKTIAETEAVAADIQKVIDAKKVEFDNATTKRQRNKIIKDTQPYYNQLRIAQAQVDALKEGKPKRAPQPATVASSAALSAQKALRVSTEAGAAEAAGKTRLRETREKIAARMKRTKLSYKEARQVVMREMEAAEVAAKVRGTTAPAPAPAPKLKKAAPAQEGKAKRLRAGEEFEETQAQNVSDVMSSFDIEGKDVFFSRGPTANPSTTASVNAELGKVFTDLGRVQIYDSVDALIAANPQYAGKIPANARGFVDTAGNKAFLIAENIDKGRALSVLLHEVGAHIGLKNMLGDAQYNALVNAVKGWEKRNDGSIESRIAQAARARVEAAETPASQVNDELLAYAVEEAVNAGVKPMETKGIVGQWLSRIAALVKRALQKFGLAPKELTADELVNTTFGAAKMEMAPKVPQVSRRQFLRGASAAIGSLKLPPLSKDMQLDALESAWETSMAAARTWFDAAEAAAKTPALKAVVSANNIFDIDNEAVATALYDVSPDLYNHLHYLDYGFSGETEADYRYYTRSYLEDKGVKAVAELQQALKGMYQNVLQEVKGTQTPEVGELFFSKKPKYNANMAKAGRVTDQLVSERPGFFAKLKENLLGLGFRTQYIDALAPLEKVAGQVGDAVKAMQMMYYLRMYGQRMNFTSLAVTDGVPQLVEKKRKDGSSEWVIESVPGVNIKDIVGTLSAKDVIKAAGSPDAANRLFTLYMAKLRADSKGYDALNFGRAAAEAELKDIERELASGKLSADDTARVKQRRAHLEKTKDTLPTEKDIKEAFAEIQADPVLREAFATARDQYNEYNRNLLQFMVQTGAMSKEEAERLLKNKDYIPYYRVRGGAAELVIGGETPVRIGNLKDSPHLQELVGGEEPIFSFLDSSVQNTSMLIDMSMRNIAVKNAMWEMASLGYAKIRKASKAGAPQGAVEFKKDGEDWYAMVDTEHIGIPSDLLVKGLSGIPTMFPAAVQVMGIPSRFLRRAITASPMYAFRQLMRDSTSAFIASGANTTPVLSALKQIGKASAIDRRGITGGQVFTGTAEDKDRLLAEMQSGRPGWAKAFSKLEAMSMEADAASRRSQYESYIKQGLSEMEATMMTLESMNFSRRGVSPSMQMLTTLIPFVNAQIQSLDVLYRSFRGQMPFNDRLKIREKLITRGLLVSGMTIAYALAMQDDEDYQNATPDQKYNNWFVRIPGVEEAVRIPIPFELGYIFKALPEAIVNAMYAERGADEAKDAALGILRNLIPGGSNYMVPAAVKPLIEVGLGKSFFTGRDLETGAEKMQEPWARYRDTTSEIAKGLGAVFNISPIKIEALVSGYTGGMGLALLQAANFVLPAPESAKAEKRLSELPVIGSAFQPKDAAGIINDTFDRLKEATEAKQTYDKLIERGEYKRADAYLSQNADRMALASLAGQYRQQIGKITEAERQIRGIDMDPKEKREILDAMRQQKILVASSVRAVLGGTALQ